MYAYCQILESITEKYGIKIYIDRWVLTDENANSFMVKNGPAKDKKLFGFVQKFKVAEIHNQYLVDVINRMCFDSR